MAYPESVKILYLLACLAEREEAVELKAVCRGRYAEAPHQLLLYFVENARDELLVNTARHLPGGNRFVRARNHSNLLEDMNIHAELQPLLGVKQEMGHHSGCSSDAAPPVYRAASTGVALMTRSKSAVARLRLMPRCPALR